MQTLLTLPERAELAAALYGLEIDYRIGGTYDLLADGVLIDDGFEHIGAASDAYDALAAGLALGVVAMPSVLTMDAIVDSSLEVAA